MELKDAITLIDHAYFAGRHQSVWADLGCGSGLFTYALAHLLEKGSTIYAWDKDPVVLSKLPNPQQVNIRPGQLDFLAADLPATPLDGILMANSLHYVAAKSAFIDRVTSHLNDKGVFLVVEYDTTAANHWVPYPIPFLSLKTLFQQAGFTTAIKINERPSVFRSGNMYAALFKKP